MMTDRQKLLAWVSLRTLDHQLDWDYQETPLGGVFKCDGITKYILLSNPSWFVVKERRDDGSVGDNVLWLEGELCRAIYAEIWHCRPAWCGNIPTMELDVLMTPLVETWHRSCDVYHNIQDNHDTGTEEAPWIVSQYVERATESFGAISSEDSCEFEKWLNTEVVDSENANKLKH